MSVLRTIALLVLALSSSGCSMIILAANAPPDPEPVGVLPLGASIASSTNGAPDALKPTCGSRGDAGEHIYLFSVTTRGSYTFDLSSSFDGVLSVMQPDNVMACNDDYQGSRASRIARQMDPGLYWIVVDGYGDNEGSYVLNASMEQPSFRGAIALGATVSGTTAGSSDEYSLGCGETGPDQGFVFSAPRTGRYEFVVTGDFDTVLGAQFQNSELACNDDSPHNRRSSLMVELAQGHSINLVVGGYRGATGAYSLTATPVEMVVSVAPPAPVYIDPSPPNMQIEPVGNDPQNPVQVVPVTPANPQPAAAREGEPAPVEVIEVSEGNATAGGEVGTPAVQVLEVPDSAS